MTTHSRRSSSDSLRNGRGHRAYRRKALQLRNRYQRLNLPCSWCGRPFDWDLDPQDSEAFTADHTEAIANGGHLVAQDLTGMHRSCNARKGSSTLPVIRSAT